MSDEVYSTTERLSQKARSTFAGVQDGTSMLTLIVILSGILSALFFWQYSPAVFTNVWPPLALLLGLLVGLAPAEGAFFGWKRVRQAKQDMTEKQLKATQYGIVAAVASSVFSTFALFVVSFREVPAEIRQYSTWFVFLALGLPIILQVMIFAWFAVNERSVVENHERSKLGAMGFGAWIRAEQARMQSIIDGMDRALDARLQDYGAGAGAHEADRLLRDGSAALLEMGNRGSSAAPTPTPTAAPAASSGPRTLPDVGRMDDAEIEAQARAMLDLIPGPPYWIDDFRILFDQLSATNDATLFFAWHAYEMASNASMIRDPLPDLPGDDMRDYYRTIAGRLMAPGRRAGGWHRGEWRDDDQYLVNWTWRRRLMDCHTAAELERVKGQIPDDDVYEHVWNTYTAKLATFGDPAPSRAAVDPGAINVDPTIARNGHGREG